MSTASNASQNIRETTEDAREAVRKVREIAAESSDKLQKDNR